MIGLRGSYVTGLLVAGLLGCGGRSARSDEGGTSESAGHSNNGKAGAESSSGGSHRGGAGTGGRTEPGSGGRTLGAGGRVVSNGGSPNANGGSPNANGGSPNPNGGSPNANGGSPNANGGSPNANGGSPNANGGSPNANGGSPNANGGAAELGGSGGEAGQDALGGGGAGGEGTAGSTGDAGYPSCNVNEGYPGCNGDPMTARVLGTCQEDGTCLCEADAVINPLTGRCIYASGSDCRNADVAARYPECREATDKAHCAEHGGSWQERTINGEVVQGSYECVCSTGDEYCTCTSGADCVDTCNTWLNTAELCQRFLVGSCGKPPSDSCYFALDAQSQCVELCGEIVD